MRTARLTGNRQMQVERIAVPSPQAGEIQVKIEACGVCATDARKYEIGVNDGHYPFNPGHEWLGHVSAAGPGVNGFQEVDRVYGDTYGGYADHAVIPVSPIDWSRGYPRGSVLTAEEVAGTISFLASDAAAGINGEALTVALGGRW